jgi:3'(2'), 5'-bisphosphate nucleotidase
MRGSAMFAVCAVGGMRADYTHRTRGHGARPTPLGLPPRARAPVHFALMDISRALLGNVCMLALRAGEAVMRVYGSAFTVAHKADASPVTAADDAAEAVILPGLAALDASTPIISEEAYARNAQSMGVSSVSPAAPNKRFWLVDPLDGTKEFIARNGEFTVNIALVEDGAPILGVVLAPAQGQLWCGARGLGAFAPSVTNLLGSDPNKFVTEAAGIACRCAPAQGLTLLGSRSHAGADDDALLAPLLGGQHIAERMVAGSSLKFCHIAQGQADLYPRFGPTMEWDTAAGHAVLLAAGGSVRTLDGAPLAYGKAGYRNPHFVARGLGGVDGPSVHP